jgi:hypothetical protein
MNKLIQKKCPLIKPLQFIIIKYIPYPKLILKYWEWPVLFPGEYIRLIFENKKMKVYVFVNSSIGHQRIRVRVTTNITQCFDGLKLTYDLTIPNEEEFYYIRKNPSLLILEGKKVVWIKGDDGDKSNIITVRNFTIEDNTILIK